MKIVAMLNRSDGNAEVGSMWTEAKIFPCDVTVGTIIKWAQGRLVTNDNILRERLTLQISEEPE